MAGAAAQRPFKDSADVDPFFGKDSVVFTVGTRKASPTVQREGSREEDAGIKLGQGGEA